MRTLSLLSLLFLMLSCSPTPPDSNTTEETTAEQAPEVTAATAMPVSNTEEATPIMAEPRPRTATVETKADPGSSQPRPTVRPDVVLKETASQDLPKEKVAKGIEITEAPMVEEVPQPAAPKVEEAPAPVAVTKTTPDHSGWDAFLQSNVSSSGQVNYRSIKANPAPLNDYLAELEQYPPQSSWNRNTAMAYWINAYNAYTVKLIVNNYPVSSIKDIDSGNPWGTKWIKLGGQTYSLNQIENDILRPRYGDARIHFAVNCAAASCPPLHNRAFTADNLNSTLQRLTRKFVNNKDYNTITAKRVEISKIFDWYGSDFGSVVNYINGYTDTALNSDTVVTFKEYDWKLNER
ncbi:DUF547 domain-containing protein [Lewinella cohaerens]|uniref:DUF547 domain-containing protein n=1 Tax=Lewinella cohaerens TaxID=70995 RepID=UPI0003795251|nr:DUF547 domain-containing protein [Lewinella cohaerens]